MASPFPLAISGASGQLGRMIIAALLERGVQPGHIIAITRSPDKLADFAARGIVVRKGDFDYPGAELEAAFSGAARALIVSTTPEAPYVEGKRFIQQTAGIDAAIAAGVPHIFYTSAPSPEPPTPAVWKKDHYLTEQYLRGTGVTWTILRHGEWPDWHLEESWKPALASGRFPTGAGDGRIAHITREDTAAADAGALLAPYAANRIYEITGPEAVNAQDIFAMIETATGRHVSVVKVELSDLTGQLERAGANPMFVPIFVMLAEAVALGKYELVSGDAERLAGRPTTRMREFLTKALKEAAQ